MLMRLNFITKDFTLVFAVQKQLNHKRDPPPDLDMPQEAIFRLQLNGVFHNIPTTNDALMFKG